MAVILMYQLKKGKEELIQEIGKKLNIQTKMVSPSDYGETLGYLAGISGFPRTGKQGISVEEEMLVFSGITEEMLDDFLAEYQKSGVSKVGLKAMLTPYNIFWNSGELFLELQKERTGVSVFSDTSR